MNCWDNWLAWEIENWLVVKDDWDRLVVSWSRIEYRAWQDGLHFEDVPIYNGKKAIPLSHCEYVNPTNKQLIDMYKERYDLYWPK